MVEGVIGPIDLDHTELYDNNSISITGEESFTIVCTNTQAKQIMGLCGEVKNETYNKTNILTSKSDWGVIWVDSSLGLSSNEDIAHRGWYLPINAEPETDLGSEYVHLTFTGWKLSSYEHDYLLMDYTPGVNDGTVIDHGYSDTSTVYALQDTFTTYASPTTWAATVKSGMTTGSFSASPAGYLCAKGQSNSDGVWNGMYTYTVTELPYPSTLEFDLRYQATPADKSHYMVAYLTPTEPTTYAMLTVTSLRILLEVTKSGVYYYITRYSSGTKTHLKSKVPLGTSKSPKFKVVAESGNLNIYIDKTGSSGYSKIYSSSLASSGMSWISSKFYMAYQFQNMDNTSATCYSSFCNDYYDTNTSYNNIVALPCTTPITTRDFSRFSSDGLIPCYRNPSSELYFWQDYENYYNGSVKAYNSNYTDTTPRIVTSTDEVLDPSKFYVSNGLIKLTTSSSSTTPVSMSVYASPAGWTTLQNISPNTINLLKPLYISPERHTYQINDTKWTIQRGKQHVKVEHPFTPLTYKLGYSYYHDTTPVTTPVSGADLTMTTQYYTNVSGYVHNNLFTANVGTGTDRGGNTTGFTSLGTTPTTLTSASTPYYNGSKSLKAVTAGGTTNEGFYVSCTGPTAGQTTVSEMIYSSPAGASLTLLVKDDSFTIIGTTNITGMGTWQQVTCTVTPAEGRYVKYANMVTRSTPQAITFYADEIVSVAGTLPAYNSMDLSTGDLITTPTNNCFQIIQTEPTTIKSDSIPAASITGLGFYEATPQSAYSNYTAISGEFMKQTSQKVNIRKV